MTPIKDLFDKIKWDPKERKEDYEIGYWDGRLGREIRIKYENIKEYDNKFFQNGDNEIPMHRIKKVYKNGKLVWERK